MIVSSASGNKACRPAVTFDDLHHCGSFLVEIRRTVRLRDVHDAWNGASNSLPVGRELQALAAIGEALDDERCGHWPMGVAGGRAVVQGSRRELAA